MRTILDSNVRSSSTWMMDDMAWRRVYVKLYADDVKRLWPPRVVAIAQLCAATSFSGLAHDAIRRVCSSFDDDDGRRLWWAFQCPEDVWWSIVMGRLRMVFIHGGEDR